MSQFQSPYTMIEVVLTTPTPKRRDVTKQQLIERIRELANLDDPEGKVVISAKGVQWMIIKLEGE